jgi:hypothetical protein
MLLRSTLARQEDRVWDGETVIHFAEKTAGDILTMNHFAVAWADDQSSGIAWPLDWLENYAHENRCEREAPAAAAADNVPLGLPAISAVENEHMVRDDSTKKFGLTSASGPWCAPNRCGLIQQQLVTGLWCCASKSTGNH